MANQFLSLSMFLMLLSFFIVLNSMSTFEKEVAVPAVLNSLSMAFSKQENKLIKEYINIGPATRPSPHESGSGDGDTLETIEGLFNAHLAGFKMKRNRLGTVMHVSLPIDEFEKAIKTSNLEAPQGGDTSPLSFSQTMITLLRSAEKENPYRIDMVYNLENDPMILLRGAPDTFKYELIRVSALAGHLERKGMPKKMVSVGLTKGKPDIIDLYFYRYKPLAVSDEIKKMQEEEAKERAEDQVLEEKEKEQPQNETEKDNPGQIEQETDTGSSFVVPSKD